MSFNLSEHFAGQLSRELTLRSGAYLFHRGEAIQNLYQVLDGEIQLLRHQENGAAIVLQCAMPGDIVAEASVFSERYHCDAIALDDSTLVSLSKETFIRHFRSNADFAQAWATYLARGIREARLRGEILSLKTVAERLDAWFDWHGSLPPRGEWKQIALQLAVSPEALYREIAKRRNSKDGK